MKKLTPEAIEALKNKINNGRVEVSSDNPLVERTKIVADAVKVLADDKNEIFSQLDKAGIFSGRQFIDETLNFALTESFADHPLQDLEERLEEAGIMEEIKTKDKDGNETIAKVPVRIDIPVLKIFSKQWLKRRHLVNRSRVKEYIDALDAGSVKELARPQPERIDTNIRGRLG